MLIPAIVTWTDEDTGEVQTSNITGEVDVYTLASENQPQGWGDCAEGWFREWDIDLLGWELSVAADFDPRPARWGFYAQWLRRHRSRLFDWLGSFASLTLCVGPVAVSVSALRTRRVS